MKENVTFTARVIRALQDRPSNPDTVFVAALTDYLLRCDRLALDFERGLFWVLPPSGQPQVAVWLILDPEAA